VNIVDIAELLVNERKAKKYIEKLARQNARIVCPFCRFRKHYKVRRGYFMCARCLKEYTPFTGTIFAGTKLPFTKWIGLIKLFELGLSARHASIELSINYRTALKVFHLIRHALVYSAQKIDEELTGEVELDESYFGGHRKGNRGRGAAGKTKVFGILERNGKVKVNVVPNVKAETLTNEVIKVVRRGSIVYTDKFKGYDALMYCGYKHLKVDHKLRFANGKVYINGLEGFWSYAKQRLAKFHGVSPDLFPLYLKEMEWRYNNRNEPDRFSLLVRFLSLLKVELYA
jgi:transposase